MNKVTIIIPILHRKSFSTLKPYTERYRTHRILWDPKVLRCCVSCSCYPFSGTLELTCRILPVYYYGTLHNKTTVITTRKFLPTLYGIKADTVRNLYCLVYRYETLLSLEWKQIVQRPMFWIVSICIYYAKNWLSYKLRCLAHSNRFQCFAFTCALHIWGAGWNGGGGGE